MRFFPISSVRLREGLFRQAQQTDLKYILELDPERLLAPFRIDAGIPPKAEEYGNWENTGMGGHTGGHYLSALSFMYAATGNPEVLRRLNYMVDSLAECQEKNGNGYVGGIPDGKTLWKEIAAGKISAEGFSLNGKWVPLYNIHKLLAGLRDAYTVGGNSKALGMLVRLCDWFLELTGNLSDDQIQAMLRSEHGGLNEVFADVAEIKQDEKYLALARRFSHRDLLNPLLEKRVTLTSLHANTQIPKVIGFKRIAEVSGDREWADAADFFWTTVIQRWTVSIGGNSVAEHFNIPSDFSSMVSSNEGPETCNTYNMLRLTRLLFQSNPESRYLDYMERALYNHILSSQHPTKGGFVYFTPMRPRHYRVYSQPQECFWCCVGSGMENHGKYGELIYSHDDYGIFVNLFIPSVLEWKEKGVTLTQDTKFPDEESSRLTLVLDAPRKLGLSIRRPGWISSAGMSIRVNGEAVDIPPASGAYVTIEREWKSGDTVTFNLPMSVHLEYLPDKSAWVSILYGPIVLAAATDSDQLYGLWAGGGRWEHKASGPFYPLDAAPAIVSKTKDFSSAIKPVSGRSLTFTISDVVAPEKYKNLELVPFYRIHEARYVVYWPVKKP